MAEMNAQVGVTRAAYYPNITLSASVGLENTSITNWFTWPSRFFSVGPSASETIFDFGARRGAGPASPGKLRSHRRQLSRDGSHRVSASGRQYRRASHSRRRTQAARRSGPIRRTQSKIGQRSLPRRNRSVSQRHHRSDHATHQPAHFSHILRQEQMTRSVQLLEALGGGWASNQLPAPNSIAHPASAAPNPSHK